MTEFGVPSMSWILTGGCHKWEDGESEKNTESMKGVRGSRVHKGLKDCIWKVLEVQGC